MSYKVWKQFTKDNGNDVLIIRIEHDLNKDKWKNRLLLFNSETATYKKERKKEQWQKQQQQ